MTLPLSLVVAVADNGVIGGDNRLLWRLKSDLRHFRDLTWGKPIIMGRKTFQSIGKPLPGRTTIVLTRDKSFAAQAEELGVRSAGTWDEALAEANRAAIEMNSDGIAIVGGAEIYALALPHVRFIHMTEVHTSPDGDTYFPFFAHEDFYERSREAHPAGGENEFAYTFVGLERKNAH